MASRNSLTDPYSPSLHWCRPMVIPSGTQDASTTSGQDDVTPVGLGGKPGGNGSALPPAPDRRYLAVLRKEAPSRLHRFLRDHLVPVALTALVLELQHARWIVLVPVAPTLAIGYGRGALFLGATAAFVASAAFIRENQDYGVSQFLLTVLVTFAILPPIISAPQRYSLGLQPPEFQILLVFAYLGLHVATGIFLGGLWTVVVKTFYR